MRDNSWMDGLQLFKFANEGCHSYIIYIYVPTHFRLDVFSRDKHVAQA